VLSKLIQDRLEGIGRSAIGDIECWTNKVSLRCEITSTRACLFSVQPSPSTSRRTGGLLTFGGSPLLWGLRIHEIVQIIYFNGLLINLIKLDITS